MKRIGLMGAVGALTMALLVPAAVSAHGATTSPSPSMFVHLDKARCTSVGGKYGFGKVVIQMSAYARNDLVGEPTPNYIVISGWVEQKIDGVWVMLGGGGSTRTPIHPDGGLYGFQNLYGTSLSFDTPDHPPRRMVMRVEFFDDLESGDVRLFKISARTAAC